MAYLGFVHGTCHPNGGSCNMYCMLYTLEDDNDNSCNICGHLRQFHEVGHIYLITKVTIQSEVYVWIFNSNWSNHRSSFVWITSGLLNSADQRWRSCRWQGRLLTPKGDSSFVPHTSVGKVPTRRERCLLPTFDWSGKITIWFSRIAYQCNILRRRHSYNFFNLLYFFRVQQCQPVTQSFPSLFLWIATPISQQRIWSCTMRLPRKTCSTTSILPRTTLGKLASFLVSEINCKSTTTSSFLIRNESLG